MRIVIDTNKPNATTTGTATTGPLGTIGTVATGTTATGPLVTTSAAPYLPAPNLKQITARLEARLGDSLPGSFLHGKTRMRNEVMDMLECSAVRAERIVDTLVEGGHARFRKPAGRAIDPRVGQWHLQHQY